MTTPASSGAAFHALRFGRAASRYEERARVQARMAEALVDLWGNRLAPTSILEFGCGTGLLTRALRGRFPAARIVASDASPEMLDAARPAHASSAEGNGNDVTFQVLNARGDAPPPEHFQQGAPPDLLAANALVQWFPDLASHFRFAASLAASDTSLGARYLVSGFDRTNFPELNALLAEPPFGYRTFPGHAREEVERAAAEAGWSVEAFVAWEERETLPTARAVLKLLQELGSVRDPREGGRMNRANLKWLLDEYARRYVVEGEGGGVRLTWKPWAALLFRP